MPTDEEIIAYHTAHPLLSPNHIARRLGTSLPRTVRVINHHLVKARPPQYEPSQEEIAEFMRINRAAKIAEREGADGPGMITRRHGECREFSVFAHNGKIYYQPK